MSEENENENERYYKVAESALIAIADAIRFMHNSGVKYTLDVMPTAIKAIKTEEGSTFNNIRVVDMNVKLDVSPQNPNSIPFTETLTPVGINNVIGITGVAENIEASQVLERYLIETAKADDYEYNKEYVSTDDVFALQTTYVYNESVEQEINSGRMCSVAIKTDDKSSVESMVMK